MAAIRSVHIEHGLGDPLANTLRLERVLRGIKRSQASRGPPRPPRLPVTRDTMLTIRSVLDLSAPDNRMLWAAACTAWFGFLRISEFTCPPSGFRPELHLSFSDLAVDSHAHPSPEWSSPSRLLRPTPFARASISSSLAQTDFCARSRPSLPISAYEGILPALFSASRTAPPRAFSRHRLVALHPGCRRCPRQILQPQLRDWRRDLSECRWYP